MVDAHQLAVFILVIVVMVLLPGQDLLFVLARSARGGARRGLIAMLGIITAFFLVHVTGAALGISALIAKSAILFNALKYVGAAYLVISAFERCSRAIVLTCHGFPIGVLPLKPSYHHVFSYIHVTTPVVPRFRSTVS